MSRYSFVLSLAVSRAGAAYFADTTRSCAPLDVERGDERPGIGGIGGGDGVELRARRAPGSAASPRREISVPWMATRPERQSNRAAGTHRRVRMIIRTSAEGSPLLPPMPPGSIRSTEIERSTRQPGAHPMKSGSSSSAARPWRGRRGSRAAPPRPALSAATIAIPSRAGVMMACWTTPAVSSMRWVRSVRS